MIYLATIVNALSCCGYLITFTDVFCATHGLKISVCATVYVGDDSPMRADAMAAWRTTFMVEYSGGGQPERSGNKLAHLTDEAVWEDKYWFHSFTRDVTAHYPPGFVSQCGGNADDELSIWGKCSCSVDSGWRTGSVVAHDQSPCDSANNSYACIRTLDLGNGVAHKAGRSEAEVAAHGALGGNYSANFIYCEFDDAEDFKEYYDRETAPTRTFMLIATVINCPSRSCFDKNLAGQRCV